jgi:hypothetical protein
MNVAETLTAARAVRAQVTDAFVIGTLGPRASRPPLTLTIN